MVMSLRITHSGTTDRRRRKSARRVGPDVNHSASKGATILPMAARGQAQNGKTGESDPAKTVRAQATLPPGDPVRTAYDELVARMHISGAEVVRKAILALWEDQNRAGAALREAG